MPVRVCIVDDHAVVRDGLRLILEARGEMTVVAEASDGLEAVRAVTESKPDVVLLDIALPRMNGIDALKRIKDVSPGTRVVMLTMHGTVEHILRAVEAGADGYLLKESAGREAAEAVNCVCRGRHYFGRGVLRPVRHPSTRAPVALSSRERECLQLTAEGNSDEQIAAAMGLSRRTVAEHRRRLLSKLGAKDVPALVRFAIESGFVDRDDEQGYRAAEEDAFALDTVLAEMVGGFCHDLGNCLEMCMICLDRRNISKSKRAASAAVAAVKDLHQFVQQFYYSEGQASLVSMDAIEDTVRELCRPIIGRKKVRLDVHCASSSQKSSLPRVLLRHVLVPLVDNAVEAVALRKDGASRNSVRVEVDVGAPGLLLRIAVEDSGVGWGEGLAEVRRALREGERVSTKGRTRGFGLQNVRRVVLKLGGDIRLSARTGGGARVEVWIERRSRPCRE